MAYRVAKKTTKLTENKCLKCKHHKMINPQCNIIECVAPNRCIISTFSAKDFYCIEYRSISEMDDYEKRKLQEKIQSDYSQKAYKEYCNKYYPKKMAQKMIKEKFGK